LHAIKEADQGGLDQKFTVVPGSCLSSRKNFVSAGPLFGGKQPRSEIQPMAGFDRDQPFRMKRAWSRHPVTSANFVSNFKTPA
jgi:hypothetical protein